jgi:pilus retraction protein PilT
MEKLNEFLQALLSTCSEELHLEPEKIPYLVSASGNQDVSNSPMLGTQISMMIFPLIPPDAKAALPHNSEVEFVHPHALGDFNFVVQKSPAGFNVTIRPMLSDMAKRPPVSTLANEGAPPIAEPVDVPFLTVDPEPIPEPASESAAYVFESASAGIEYNAEISAPVNHTPDLIPDIPPMVPDYPTSSQQPGIEVVSVSDPEFTTVFSDEAAYEPPGSRDDFTRGEYVPPVFDQISSPTTPQSFAASPEAVPPPYQPPAPIPTPEPPKLSFEAAPPNSAMSARMDALFVKMAEIGASDLHMSVSVAPMMRKDGKMKPLESSESTLTPEVMRELLTSIMPARNQEEFAERNDTDFAYEIPGLARFRCNIYMDRKGMGAVFRIIPSKILTAEQLGLSKAIMDLCSLSKGLVVVTGPTGSGKSTTLCAMVDSINKSREDHIITIEDPIEFVHENQKCLVNQREVHNHTDSFKDALRAALREDPDIVLVGEMRDLETISIAIETAETGHLVFGTLHTTTAPSTVDRIIDQFPAD